MSKQILSEKKARAIYLLLFLSGLALLYYINSWWPSILLVVGLPLALRQFLIGRRFDCWTSILVFGGLYAVFFVNLKTDTLIPVLLVIAGLYIFIRDFFETEPTSKVRSEMDRELEIRESREHSPIPKSSSTPLEYDEFE